MLDNNKAIKIESWRGPKIDAELKNDKKILGTPNAVWKSSYTQQGDCLLVKVGSTAFKNLPKEIPADVKELKQNLVLKGSTNSHALYGGDFQMFEDASGTRYIRVNAPAVLAHVKDLSSLQRAEHHGMWIPKGDYVFRNILETDHLAKLTRVVID